MAVEPRPEVGLPRPPRGGAGRKPRGRRHLSAPRPNPPRRFPARSGDEPEQPRQRPLQPRPPRGGVGRKPRGRQHQKAPRPNPPRRLPARSGNEPWSAGVRACGSGATRRRGRCIPRRIVGHRAVVERHAQAFGGLAGALRRDYIAACEKVGTAPNTALVERVERALGGGANADEASVEAQKAKIDNILDAPGKTGALDEDALAELP